MKIVLLLFMLCGQVLAIGQHNPGRLFSQVLVSSNLTLKSGNGEENTFGYGAGCYHAFNAGMPFQSMLGLEFNRNNLFNIDETIGHFGNWENLTYHKNSISFPVTVSVHANTRNDFYFEVGAFWDWVISSSKTGTVHSYIPDSNHNVIDVYKRDRIEANLSSGPGVCVGLGFCIPTEHFDIVIKPDYTLKFNKPNAHEKTGLNRYFRLGAGIKFKQKPNLLKSSI